MTTVKVTSPTRIDLAGGTLDLWPLYTFVNEAVTINLAIDIMTEVEVEELDGEHFILDLKNVNYHKNFKNLDLLLKSKDTNVKFIHPHLKFWKPRTGLKISVYSQSPVGGGLGGSSSVTAGLTKAFCVLNNKNLSDLEIVRLSHNLEAEILHKPTGTQDYVPPLKGGLNFIRYNMDNIYVETMSFPQEILSNKGFLVYTGVPHHSGLNNWEVLTKAIKKNKLTLKSLEELKKVACGVEKACLDQEWDALDTLFKEEYKWRTRLAKAFSSPKIEKIKKIVGSRGVVKICGAGGGGCVLVWCKDTYKKEVLDKCQKEGFQVFDIKVVDRGCQVLKN